MSLFPCIATLEVVAMQPEGQLRRATPALILSSGARWKGEWPTGSWLIMK